MFELKVTKEQLEMLFVCLDTQLKTSGLQSLGMVVDLQNMLQSAKQEQVAPVPAESDVPEPEVETEK